MLQDLSTLSRLTDLSLFEDERQLLVYGTLSMREFKVSLKFSEFLLFRFILLIKLVYFMHETFIHNMHLECKVLLKLFENVSDFLYSEFLWNMSFTISGCINKFLYTTYRAIQREMSIFHIRLEEHKINIKGFGNTVPTLNLYRDACVNNNNY